MKTHSILLFFVVASFLTAQDKPKGMDPFVKDKQAQPAAASTAGTSATEKAKPATTPPCNVLCLVETITLPQTGYAVLLEGPPGSAKLYEMAQEAVKRGVAKLDGCHFLTHKSGQRALQEGVDELMHPTEWSDAASNGFQYMTALEAQRLGDRLEVETVLEPSGGSLMVTQSVTRASFHGFRFGKADSALPGVPFARFIEQVCPSSCNAVVGVPTLLSTLTNANSGAITLVFATFKVKEFSDAAKATPKSSGNVVMTARVVSLDRAAGCSLLKKHWQNDGACLAELKTMMTAQQATLEHISSVVAVSGTRISQQGGDLYHYGTEFDSPGEATVNTDKNVVNPARTASLRNGETRQLGFSWEIESVVNAEGSLIDTTVAFSNTRVAGLKDKDWPEHYPELPVFSSQNITTSCTHAAGTTLLLGTLNPPGDTGVNERKDEGRMWLVFLDASLE